MATAKQIAWRKKFAAMAKAGAFKKNPAAKKKPAAKSARSYVNRPSQITKTAPTKRLKARRVKNVPGSGYFPNPGKLQKPLMKYEVHSQTSDGKWTRLAIFATATSAKQYALAIADIQNGIGAVRVWTK
jgi:hypothetical protein